MKVIIADDEAVSRRLLEATLRKWGYEVTVCSDGLDAWNQLENPAEQCLAILDWEMPGLEGLEVCRRIRERGSEPYVYILMLTSRNQKDDTVVGLEAGADDYLTKPFDYHELRVRLRVGHRILDLQGELIKAREALKFQATHDVLTGVWNRGAILDFLVEEVSRARREGSRFGIAMIDIDHFKRLNDNHGHQIGDAVLVEVAKRIGRTLRPYDRFGRYGGEEFLAILPGCDLMETGRVIERIRQEICRSEICVEKQTFLVTCSAGVSAPTRTTDLKSGDLIAAADTALYQAKLAGKNRVVALAQENALQTTSE